VDIGSDVHFLILQNAQKILKLIPVISAQVELNKLEKIEDSVQLCLLLFQIKKMTRLVPCRNMYPDPKAPEAAKPKQVRAAPLDQ
jgi:hypothetical protein